MASLCMCCETGNDFLQFSFAADVYKGINDFEYFPLARLSIIGYSLWTMKHKCKYIGTVDQRFETILNEFFLNFRELYLLYIGYICIFSCCSLMGVVLFLLFSMLEDWQVLDYLAVFWIMFVSLFIICPRASNSGRLGDKNWMSDGDTCWLT